MTHRYLSKVSLPEHEQAHATVLEFLIRRFPHIAPQVWEQRTLDGKVLDEQGSPVTTTTPYRAGRKISYFREVADEPVIPFEEKVIFQNDDLLVACKPHFLPVNPTGPYVGECLVNRLRRRSGNDDLVPINRIDRETAGIVLFSTSKTSRNAYYELFREGKVAKTYEAIAEYAASGDTKEWQVENRIVSGEPWFRMKVDDGEPNSRSVIRLAEVRGNRARFLLHPLTGKTHQLRLHMSCLGFRILNDRYYPDLQPESEDDFDNPLQLLAKSIAFHDPVTGTDMEFVSERGLQFYS